MRKGFPQPQRQAPQWFHLKGQIYIKGTGGGAWTFLYSMPNIRQYEKTAPQRVVHLVFLLFSLHDIVYILDLLWYHNTLFEYTLRDQNKHTRVFDFRNRFQCSLEYSPLSVESTSLLELFLRISEKKSHKASFGLNGMNTNYELVE